MTKNKPVLLGTSNPHKQAMLEGILDRLKIEYVSLKEQYGLNSPDIKEDGSTFLENASIKARELSKLYDGYVIATDGGVSIPALGDKWNGLHTRRFIGETATDEERIYALLELTKDLEGEERNIIWQEALAIAKGGVILKSELYDGAKGTLLKEFDKTKYTPGIWVCSLWYLDSCGKHFFDLTPSERDESNKSWQKIEDSISDFFKKR